MKYLLLILLFPVLAHANLRDTVPQGVPQLFGAKYYKFNAYILVDSFIMSAPGDTNNIPYYPSLKFKNSDKRWYVYDLNKWHRLLWDNDTSFLGGGLQEVTQRGNRTTDTIWVKGLSTNSIFTQTVNESDYEIDVFPDLQNMTKNSPSTMYGMFDWVVANKTSNNIRAVIQVGDLTQDATAVEFRRIDTAFKKFDAINLPYVAVIGNHDYDGSSTCNFTTVDYNTWLGPTRFSGKPFYGGNLSGKNDNYFINFSAGSKQYRVIGLEYFPTDSAVNWAKSVLDTTSKDVSVIIATHGYITGFGEKSVDTSLWSSPISYCNTGARGQQLWDRLIKLYPQISMVVSGHYIYAGVIPEPPVVQRITQAGVHGNIVEQFVTNYQSDSLDGRGYFMRMKFRPRLGKVDISFFSSLTGLNDPRHPAYTLDYPGLSIEAAVGISGTNGSLNVSGNTRIDSNLYISSLPKNRMVITGINGKIDTIPDQTANKFLGSPVSGTGNPGFRALVASDIPAGSGNYIQNIAVAGSPQTASYFISGQAAVSTLAGIRQLLSGNSPASFYVAQGSGNYGLSIQRTGLNNNGSAHLTFFKNRAADYTTLAAVAPGFSSGDINWQGVSGDNATIYQMCLIDNFITKVAPTYVAAGFRFQTTDSNGTITDRMYFSPEGTLRVGGITNITPGTKLEVQSGVGYFGDKIGIGTATPTARLHLPAGTATANTAPLKFTTGSNLSTPENGALEFDGTHFYGTIGSTRYQLDQQGGSDGNGIYSGSGSLSTATTITGAGNVLSLTGTQSSLYAFNIANTGNGGAISGSTTGTGSAATFSNSSSGAGITGTSSSGFGGNFTSTTGLGLRTKSTPSSTNTVVTSFRGIRGTSGTAAIGMGNAWDMQLTDDAGNDVTATSFRSTWTSAATASPSADFDIYTIVSGSSTKKFTIKPTGQLSFALYGAGTFTGSLSSYLVTTSSGDVVEQAASTLPLISTGTAAPATTPSKVGDIYIDTTNKKLYFATGTSSSADWTIAN